MHNSQQSVTIDLADSGIKGVGLNRFPQGVLAKTLRSCLLSLAAIMGAGAFFSQAQAAVYVCSNDSCSSWKAITQAQRDTKSTDGENTTIQQTLSQSADQSITNGASDPTIGNTNLYLKSSLWHTGGYDPFHGKQHVTVYIYKSTDLNKRLKTCHAFSFTNPGGKRYHATCE